MIKASSKIKFNQAKLKQLTQAHVTALEQTAEALHTEVVQAQVVPRKQGTLQNENFFVDYSDSKSGKITLVHATQYARRLYFHPEYSFHREPWEDKDGKVYDGNPNAKGEWFEDWLPGGAKEDFVADTFKQIYRRLIQS